VGGSQKYTKKKFGRKKRKLSSDGEGKADGDVAASDAAGGDGSGQEAAAAVERKKKRQFSKNNTTLVRRKRFQKGGRTPLTDRLVKARDELKELPVVVPGVPIKLDYDKKNVKALNAAAQLKAKDRKAGFAFYYKEVILIVFRSSRAFVGVWIRNNR
jgi:hypothetical protein